MTAPRRVGLTGQARAGKDTAGAHLAAAHGWQTAAFADPIRAVAAAIDPILGWEPDPHTGAPVPVRYRTGWHGTATTPARRPGRRSGRCCNAPAPKPSATSSAPASG